MITFRSRTFLAACLALAGCTTTTETIVVEDGDDGDGSSEDGNSGDGDGDGNTGGDGNSGDGDGNNPGDGDGDGSNPGDGDGDGLPDNPGNEPGEIGTDNVPPSQSPPGGLSPSDVPMFVSLGWDDNGYSGLEGSGGSGAMDWAVKMLAERKNPAGSGNAETYDGEQVTNTFYLTSTYARMWISESGTWVKRAWRAAYEGGHEIGNHTESHAQGGVTRAEDAWRTEISRCNDFISQPFDPAEPNTSPSETNGIGVPREEIFGFRTPFLEYNDASIGLVKSLDFWYDTSIEEGFQYDQDGTNFLWPYTLDNGAPGHEVQVEWGSKMPITARPGLWEMPVYVVIVPPDEECEKYGVPSGLRTKLKALQSWFDVEGGKITGFDYNLWVSFKMTKAEVLATLKYTLDQRLKGNRAPFLFGTHTDYYSSKYTGAPNATAEERQAAIEEFLDYALSKPAVRVVSYKKALDWIRSHQ